MELVLRPAVTADAALLAAMNRRLIEDSGHRNPMTVDELAARMRGRLAGSYEARIIELAGGTVGYRLFAREADGVVHIRQLFVAAAHRRQGVARAALAWLRANAWSAAPRLRMAVLAGNVAGIACWKSVGFVDYAITLECDLRGPSAGRPPRPAAGRVPACDTSGLRGPAFRHPRRRRKPGQGASRPWDAGAGPDCATPRPATQLPMIRGSGPPLQCQS
jgi:GNAT superfamily N-acetyltransferase